MKRILTISAMALAALATLVSCVQKTPELPVSKLYLTTGSTPANEVNYIINDNVLTGSQETVGLKDVALKLCSAEAVASEVSATLKVDESKVSSPWVLLPAEAYEITNANATIASGATESQTLLTLSLKPEVLENAGSYLLPLTIEVTGGNAEASSASVVNVKVVRNVTNSDIVPQGWKRVQSDRFTAGSLYNYTGVVYEGYEVSKAFDNDAKTEWYSGAYDFNTGNYADDYSYYGCFAEVTFSEPVSLAGIIVGASKDATYYSKRARRLTIMFKYEGAEDYEWDKAWGDGWEYDENGNATGEESEDIDDAYYYFCPKLEGGISANDIKEIPGYKPSPADFLISDPQYETAAIDLSTKVAGKKVVGMIIAPTKIQVDQDQEWWDEALQDYYYYYYYDYYFGTSVGEIFIFEK